MIDSDDYYEHWHDLNQAQYIVQIEQGATVLCSAHAQALRLAFEAAGHELPLFEIPDDEEPIVCQACHLAEMQRPKVILPH